jgi:hypothetical protein
LQAADFAISYDTRMRPEHIAGTLDWLVQFIRLNTDDPCKLTVDELHLICKAFGDGLAAANAAVDLVMSADRSRT